MIGEEQAGAEVTAIYANVKRDLQLPFIPNMMKAMAASPESLAFFSKLWAASIEHRTLPESLTSMISYAIATVSNCTYCSASNELTCRMLGVDEDTLDKLVSDLPNLNPERVRAIIDFAQKVAKHPKELVREDFDGLRDQGITDGEIVEIIITAALSVFSDVVADALQVDVDTTIATALEEMR